MHCYHCHDINRQQKKRKQRLLEFQLGPSQMIHCRLHHEAADRFIGRGQGAPTQITIRIVASCHLWGHQINVVFAKSKYIKNGETAISPRLTLGKPNLHCNSVYDAAGISHWSPDCALTAGHRIKLLSISKWRYSLYFRCKSANRPQKNRVAACRVICGSVTVIGMFTVNVHCECSLRMFKGNTTS